MTTQMMVDIEVQADRHQEEREVLDSLSWEEMFPGVQIYGVDMTLTGFLVHTVGPAGRSTKGAVREPVTLATGEQFISILVKFEELAGII